MTSNLGAFCEYVKGKVPVSELTETTYISTENMLPNKAGITKATSLPTVELTQVYCKGDVLVSNIRPYFKKIWQAKYDGGCSNDVLVFRAKDGIDQDFLYYILADDKFFEYAMATSKGTKMPRGDKTSIMQYRVPCFDLATQKKIASLLRTIDEKVEINTAINNNLLEQIVALYCKLVAEATKIVKIGDIAEKVAMGPFGSNIKVSTFVDSGVPIISGNHLRGFYLEEPEFNYITVEHAERLKNSNVYANDIIFTHAGNIGQVAMIPKGSKYDRYVLSQRQFYLRCKTDLVVPEYVLFFFHSSKGQHELLSYANQTGVPSIAQPASNLKKIPIPLPSLEAQLAWKDTVDPLIELYLQNRKESEYLANTRDGLLPKLMSGEVDVSAINI